jgi:uncharacterized protein (TIGR03067 family)
LFAVLSCFILLGGRCTLAQDQAKPAGSAGPAQAAVRQTIDRGLEFLRSRQSEQGYWAFEREVREQNQPAKLQEDPSYNLGCTALAALAMIENGVPQSDPAIQKAYSYVKNQAPTDKRTYNLGLTILFLTRMGSREDRSLVQRVARRVIMGQLDSGGWTYECPVDTERETSRTALATFTRKAGVGDNSNTQFAVLGLWAASRVGAPVDESLQLVAKRFRESQAATGGWDYQSTGKADSNAMTAAGVYGLTVAAAASARKTAGSDAAAPSGKSVRPSAKSGADQASAVSAGGRAPLAQDEIFQKGLQRVEQFAAAIGPGASPYFLWSIERLGVTLQMQRFGQVDWYAKGAKALLESQTSSGSWEINWFKGVPDTAFALLFLRKAHLGRDISYALTGDASKPFVLVGQEKQEAFAKLTEAVKAAADGDTIDIMGAGPFDIAGVTVTGKSLVLRGGGGYEPTLVHQIGALQDPQREPNLRAALVGKDAKISLEGLRIQTDPSPRQQLAWAAIAVDGGELRALNCSFTQSNTATVSGIELRGGAKIKLRNCLFAGFSRAIDAVVSADQTIELENCLVYSRIGLEAKNADAGNQSGMAANLARNTFHVGEVVNLGRLTGPVEFTSEGNIFRTTAFSAQLRPTSGQATRKWDGRYNVFDLTRWLAVGGQPLKDVRDLTTWRKYWNTKEEGSFNRAVPFAVKHELGPFRHNTNANDWRVTVDRLSQDIDPDVQLGSDVYLVGAGQAYFQFKESAEYEDWLGVSATAKTDGAGAAEPARGDAKLMEGVWVPVEAELAGQKLPEDGIKTLKLTLKGAEYTVETGQVIDRGTVKLDPTQTPKTMDVVGTEGPNKDKTILAIYELTADSMKVCYALEGSTRPTEFKTAAGTNLFLVTYKRDGS